MSKLKQSCNMLYKQIATGCDEDFGYIINKYNLSLIPGITLWHFDACLKKYANKADTILVLFPRTQWAQEYLKMKEEIVREFTTMFKLSEREHENTSA